MSIRYQRKRKSRTFGRKIGSWLIRCKSKYNTFLHIVKRTLLYVGLCGRRATHVALLTKRHGQLHLYSSRERCDWIMDQWGEFSDGMNCDSSFITSMTVCGYPVFQANSCFFNVQQVIHGQVAAVLSWRDVLMVVVEHTEICGLTEYQWAPFDTLRCCLYSQMEMESSSETTLHVRRLKFYWSCSRNRIPNFR